MNRRQFNGLLGICGMMVVVKTSGLWRVPAFSGTQSVATPTKRPCYVGTLVAPGICRNSPDELIG